MTAKFVCEPGFELAGKDRVKICEGDGSSPVGKWTDTLIVSCVLVAASKFTCNQKVHLFHHAPMLYMHTVSAR